MESTATLASHKWIKGEKLARFGTVNFEQETRNRPGYMTPKTYSGLEGSSPKHEKSPS